MQTVHTEALPPNQGRICLAMIGCTRNSRNALVKTVAANRIMCCGIPGVAKKAVNYTDNGSSFIADVCSRNSRMRSCQ